MEKRQNYSIEALFFFVISVLFFIYILFYVGVFSRYKYFTKTEATTGPDFWVVLGDLKLKLQMPDTIVNQDCGGIMVSKNKIEEVFKSDDSPFLSNNYYVLAGKVIGVEQSDGSAFHPLIEVTSSSHIDKFKFWILTIIDVMVLVFTGLYYWETQLKEFRDST